MYADAEFKPPPQRRRIEDSQTSRTGNTFGNAPMNLINIGFFVITVRNNIQTTNTSHNDAATPTRAVANIFLLP